MSGINSSSGPGNAGADFRPALPADGRKPGNANPADGRKPGNANPLPPVANLT
jgi:hypothetical protein